MGWDSELALEKRLGFTLSSEDIPRAGHTGGLRHGLHEMKHLISLPRCSWMDCMFLLSNEIGTNVEVASFGCYLIKIELLSSLALRMRQATHLNANAIPWKHR